MNVDFVNKAEYYALRHASDDDILRRRILAELAEVHSQLPPPNEPLNDARMGSIVAWYNSFIKVLCHPEPGHYPKPEVIIPKYIQELERTLRAPGAPQDASIPPEVFGENALPIIRFVVGKLRNRNSLLYSQRIDEEAIRVLHPEMLEQLRRMEERNTREVQVETQHMGKLQALKGRLQQKKTALQDGIDRFAREKLARAQHLREGAENLRKEDAELKEEIRESVERMRQETLELKAETSRLKRQLDDTGSQIGQIERANIQLQIEINQLRPDIADKKSDWLTQVVCIGLSVAVSWALEMPVLITPNGFSVGK